MSKSGVVMTDIELWTIADKVKENAYSPYSNIKVGAAILTESGKVFTGVNVENSSFGATVCAERSAVVSAITAGERSFVKIAVSGTMKSCTPCGICRQFLSEFSDDIIVVYKEPDGVLCSKKLRELLPDSFIY